MGEFVSGRFAVVFGCLVPRERFENDDNRAGRLDGGLIEH